jgi:hypothetical protein
MDFFDMGATFDQGAFLLAPIKSAALWQSRGGLVVCRSPR